MLRYCLIQLQSCTPNMDTLNLKLKKICSHYKIDFMSTSTDGYSFQIEMLVKALDKRVDIKELPIVFEDREDGNSKFNSAIVFEAMFTLLRLSFRKFKGN